MDLKAIFASNGLTAEQVDNILAGMKEHKIYTATQENLDVRYEKLKAKHEDLTKTHTTVTEELETLKTASTGAQELQTELEKLKGDYEALQKTSEGKLKNYAIDTNLKALLKEHKAKAKYADLLTSKIDREALQMDEHGSVTGLEDVFKGLREEYADLFDVEPPKLGGIPPAGAPSTGSGNALADQIRQSINPK